jgi:hypothetical protein
METTRRQKNESIHLQESVPSPIPITFWSLKYALLEIWNGNSCDYFLSASASYFFLKWQIVTLLWIINIPCCLGTTKGKVSYLEIKSGVQFQWKCWRTTQNIYNRYVFVEPCAPETKSCLGNILFNKHCM